MRNSFRLWIILAIGLMMFGGCGKGDNRPGATVEEQNLALKFLQGIQTGDKKAMYEATNLTEEMVNDSREKLIHQTQYKLTEPQRTEHQHALRISGQIDFFILKTRPMFPKSAGFQIMESSAKGSSGGASHFIHRVKITYADPAEAMRDKSGKPVKEMVVRLQQSTRPVGGRPVHEFSFESRDFEKFAGRDFEVLSYF